MSARAVPARVAAAVERLDPQPGDTVVELGGGPGVSAALICERLGHGLLVEVDRSATAIRRTLARNPGHAGSGLLRAHQGQLGDAGLTAGTVDRALALNVNLFWTGPGDVELTLLHEALRPGGLLVLAWGSPTPQTSQRIIPHVQEALQRNGFRAVTAIRHPHVTGLTARR